MKSLPVDLHCCSNFGIPQRTFYIDPESGGMQGWKRTPYIFKSASLFSEMPSMVGDCCLSESLLLLRRAINS